MKTIWVKCEHCGKRMMQRKYNGLFYFRFGRMNVTDSDIKDPMIEMEVIGSIRIRCWHRECRKWNVFNFFPNTISGPAESGDEGHNNKNNKKKGE